MIPVDAHALLEAAFTLGGVDLPDSAGGLLALAKGWPSVSAAGFELRLRDDEALDLGVRLDCDAGASETLRDHADPTLSRLGATWCERAKTVPFVFAEVDSRRRAGAPLSGLFARVEGHDAAAWDAVLQWLVPGPARRERRALRRCLDALPAGARPLHLGAMPGRLGSPIRWFGALPRAECAPFLRASGFESRIDSFQHAVERHAADDPFVMLQLDLMEGAARHLGFEIDCRARPAPGNAWAPLVAGLREAGLCAGPRAELLEGWPRQGRVELPGFRWPCLVRRDISHIKLSIEPEGVAEAKGYLYAEPEFRLFA